MPTNTHNPSQHTRRARYGLNVAVAIIAMILIAILVNWIGYRRFAQFDLTATRRHSLSPQTLNLLDQLEDRYELVTLFDATNDPFLEPYLEQARDLANQYARHSDRFTVQHITPGQITQIEAFYERVLSRFDQPLTPIREAIDQGLQGIDQHAETLPTLRAHLITLLKHPELGQGRLSVFLASIDREWSQFDANAQLIQSVVERSRRQLPPDHEQSRQLLVDFLTSWDETLLAPPIRELDRAAVDPESPLPNAIRDRLLQLVDQLKRAQEPFKPIIQALQSAQQPDEYDQLLRQLSRPDPLVLIGPKQTRIIALEDLLHRPDPRTLQPGQTARELGFQGQWKITGALMGMNLEHPPLVVFVCGARDQAIGRRGQLNFVAELLRDLDYQVEQWSPLGQPGPMGQTMPPGPPPTPKPGQKAIWIALPDVSTQPGDPLGGMANQQIADQVRQRLDAGDAAMVFLAANPAAPIATSLPPMLDVLKPWAITPRLDQLILREIVGRDRKTQPVAQLVLDDWPQDHPITQPLAGMPGILVQASPLVLGDGVDQGVTLWPLVRVQAADIWAEEDFTDPRQIKLDPVAADRPYTAVAAAQHEDGRRLVVATYPLAVDLITSNADPNLNPQYVGTARLGHAAYPANTELFMNSVHWLARMDQFIAASAWTQGVRRVGAIGNTAWTGLQIGIPTTMLLTAALTGTGVWLTRRRAG